MQYIITEDLTLTNEATHSGCKSGTWLLLYQGKLYGPEHKLPGYRSKGCRLVGVWALGGLGKRTDEERLAALKFLSRESSNKPIWTFRPNVG